MRRLNSTTSRGDTDWPAALHGVACTAGWLFPLASGNQQLREAPGADSHVRQLSSVCEHNSSSK